MLLCMHHRVGGWQEAQSLMPGDVAGSPLKSETRQEEMQATGLVMPSSWAPSSSAILPHSVTTTDFALQHGQQYA